MSKVKLTKGELKQQRDALRQYERYLPTLQLKKQQLQIEIIRQNAILEEKETIEVSKRLTAQSWAGLLCDPAVHIQQWLVWKEILLTTKSVAGVELSIFDRVVFLDVEYDLFVTPLWVDAALQALRDIICLREEIGVIQQGIRLLKEELRITTQRVNLFEKVKIPDAKEAIRLIKIYLGDQMTNAVGRSKIAKRKISEAAIYEAVAA